MISALARPAPCDQPLLYSAANLTLYHAREQPKQGEEHAHDEIQIAVPLGGTVIATWETATGSRKRQRVSENALFVRASRQPHAVQIVRETEMVTLWLPANALALATQEWTGGDPVEIAETAPAHDPLLQHLCLALVEEARQSETPSRLYLDTLATAMAVHLVRRYSTKTAAAPEQTRGLPPKTLRRVTEYIYDNLGTDLSLKTLARLADLSESRFCLLFHRSTRMSPYQFVIARRIAEAKRLLRMSGMPAGEVAQRVGFCDQSQFTRQFKRQTGLTPSAFARSVQD